MKGDIMDELAQQKIEELRRKKEYFESGGGPDAIAKQHAAGKLTARERVNLFCDQGSFQEYDLFAQRHSSDFYLGEVEAPTEGAITGIGKVQGRPVAIYAHDYTIYGGSVGLWHAKKMIKLAKTALSMRIPLVTMNDSGGARPQEQHEAANEGYGLFFNLHTIASGVIPQISLIMGPAAGGPCYSPALTDFTFMVKGTSYMFIGGPPAVKAGTGEDVTNEELGGAVTLASVSGVADLAVENDQECIEKAKELLSFLPSSNLEGPPRVANEDDPERCDDSLADLVPVDFKKPYDMRKVIKAVVDNGHFLEVKPLFGRSMLTGFARLNGNSIGILANQPMVIAGSIDSAAARKAARFVRFCDAFNIPIVHFVDTPAFVVGARSEHEGLILHGAKLLFAQSEATVPILSVVIRKAFGGAFQAMGSRSMNVADFVVAWPWAEFAIFNAETGLSIVSRSVSAKKHLAEAKDPEKLKAQWREEYRKKYIELYEIAPVQHADAIIEPRETRPVLIRALENIRGKKKEVPWKKHGNIPL
jgi:acetyl-CoA carboxylase carboxyltransferase component